MNTAITAAMLAATVTAITLLGAAAVRSLLRFRAGGAR